MPSYTQEYDHYEPHSADRGGDSYGHKLDVAPYDRVTERNHWRDYNAIGQVAAKFQPLRDQDGVYKFLLDSWADNPGRLQIPRGSVILAPTNYKSVNQQARGVTEDVFVAGVSRTAGFHTVTTDANWVSNALTYATPEHWQMSGRLEQAGATVSDGSVSYSKNLQYILTHRTVAFDTGVEGIAQTFHIDTLDGDGHATFDTFEVWLGEQAGGGTFEIWAEAWTGLPTGPVSPDDGGGTKLGETNHLVIGGLSQGYKNLSFGGTIDLFDQGLGLGEQDVVMWVRSDAPSDVAIVGVKWTAAVSAVPCRSVGTGQGFGAMPYFAARDLPLIHDAEDNILNGNEISGSRVAMTIPAAPFLATWVSDDIASVIQACIDEAGYVAGQPVAITVAHDHTDTGFAPHLWTPGGQIFRSYLDITFVPPPTIDSFTATPDSIPRGAGSLLEWETSESDTITLDNGIGAVPADGTMIVYPTVTTTYTLTVSTIAAPAAGHTLTRQVTVTVTEPIVPPGFLVNETTIANAALTLLGERRIDSLNEGSVLANLLGTRYPDLRDALLRLIPWNFATKRTSLAKNSEAPLWGFGAAYTLPDDCIRLLGVDDGTSRLPYEVEGRNIVTSINAPLSIIYTARIVNPAEFDPLFRDCLAAYIAVELAHAIAGEGKLHQVWDIFQQRMSIAGTVNGQEDEPLRIASTEWEGSRGRDEDR